MVPSSKCVTKKSPSVSSKSNSELIDSESFSAGAPIIFGSQINKPNSKSDSDKKTQDAGGSGSTQEPKEISHKCNDQVPGNVEVSKTNADSNESNSSAPK